MDCEGVYALDTGSVHAAWDGGGDVDGAAAAARDHGTRPVDVGAGALAGAEFDVLVAAADVNVVVHFAHVGGVGGSEVGVMVGGAECLLLGSPRLDGRLRSGVVGLVPLQPPFGLSEAQVLKSA